MDKEAHIWPHVLVLAAVVPEVYVVDGFLISSNNSFLDVMSLL